jgi:hypothetical protein
LRNCHSRTQCKTLSAGHFHQQSAYTPIQSTFTRHMPDDPGVFVLRHFQFVQKIAASRLPKGIGMVEHQALTTALNNLLQSAKADALARRNCGKA